MSEKIVIVDYGMGNLHSVNKALLKVGAQVSVSSDPIVIGAADKVILPGVGSFGDCMGNLNKYGLTQVLLKVLNSDKPFLGICLGLQLLFEDSEEAPGVKGLGFFKGQVKKIKTDFKIPHMGWNTLAHVRSDLFKGFTKEEFVYFVHSFYVPLNEFTAAQTDYILPYSSALHKDNFYATQFHPEKSGAVGERILRNFLEL